MKQGSSGPYRKGHWSVEEDIRLIQFVRKYGEGRWSKLAKAAGLQRCGKSCRLRWVNYLRPDIKRGHISEEEERLIIRLHATLGNRWSLIALHLPGRSDNEIKNYWRSHIKKKLKGEDLANIDHYSSQIDSISSEASQNVEDYNTTLIDGACYNMALGFDGYANGTESLGSTTSFETLNGVEEYLHKSLGSTTSFETLNGVEEYLHCSFNNIKSMLSSEVVLPSSYNYNAFYNYGKIDDDNHYSQPIKEDTSRFSTFDSAPIHDPSLIHTYNQVENLNEIPIETSRKIQDPSCVGSHAETWEFDTIRQPASSMYGLDENQQQSILLHDCDVPWDVETIQPIVEVQNAPYVAHDSNYGFELWDNDLFSPCEPRFQDEKNQ